jgi:hypothetical protein
VVKNLDKNISDKELLLQQLQQEVQMHAQVENQWMAKIKQVQSL